MGKGKTVHNPFARFPLSDPYRYVLPTYICVRRYFPVFQIVLFLKQKIIL